LQDVAEFAELGLDLPQHTPDLGRSLFDCQRAKPSCKLFSIAARFIGPASITRKSRCNESASPGRDTASAYKPSVGTNRIAKSVVCGDSMYLSRIALASSLKNISSALRLASTAATSARSIAACRR
jgi:hypothetical protein